MHHAIKNFKALAEFTDIELFNDLCYVPLEVVNPVGCVRL